MSESTHRASPAASSRRSFLKTTTGALGAAAVGPMLSIPPVHASGSDIIKVGLIGCGDRGTGAAIQALQADPGARLTAMADVFADIAQSSRARIRSARPDQTAVDDDRCFVGFDGYRQVIESGVDVVLIACATRFHPKYLEAAIDAGKHVFVEKPHAIDPPGIHVCLRAAEKAKQKGLCIVSGLHRRYMPEIRETVERIQDGAIGDIVFAEVSFMRAPYKIVERQPGWSEMEWQFRTWYHFRYLSGDDVPQSLVHTIDVASWAMGEALPLTAHSLAGRSASIDMKYGDVFDHSAVIYEFPKNVRVYGLVRTQHGCHGEVAVKIFGTQGWAVEGAIGGKVNWRSAHRTSGHALEQVELFKALREGRVINNGQYMANSTMTTILGQMASYTGRKLTWDDALRSSFSYPPRDREVDFDIDPPVKADASGIYPVPVPGKTQLG